jgi:small conductance mechanosensitive channel
VRTLTGFVRSAGAAAVAVVAGMMVLQTVGINPAPLIAGAGIVGLAVGFGAQSLIKDVIGGFFMLMDNQIAIGDTVTAAGITGKVEALNLRMVTVRDAEGAVHYIPNGLLATVSNYSRGWNRVVLDVGVALRADPETAQRELRAACKALAEDAAAAALLLDAPELEGLQAVRDGALVFRVSARTRPEHRADVARAMNERVREHLGRAGIELIFCNKAQ